MVLFIAICLTGCSVDPENTGWTVKDSLSCKEILGSYMFIQNQYRASRNKVSPADSLILKISDPTLSTRGGYVYRGKYQLTNNNNRKDSIIKVGSWRYITTFVGHGKYSNSIAFDGLKPDSININFVFSRRAGGALYITGYEENEESAEVFKFKKIN